MTESVQHMHLVQRLLRRTREIVAENLWIFIQSDEATSKEIPPQMYSGHRPDVYYNFNNMLIIGEAKTSKDVGTLHSKAQFETYIKTCANYKGEAVLILAVPWTEIAEANNIIKKMEKDINNYCNFEIISNLE